MTCIVAHRSGWIAADRRHSMCDTWRIPVATPKILKYQNCLFASAGAGYVKDRLMYALQGCRDEDILDCMANAMSNMKDRNDGHVLVVQNATLFHVDGTGGRYEIAHPFWSIGSGCQAALGYLAGAKRDPADILACHGVSAVEFAATLNTDCGDGVQLEHL